MKTIAMITMFLLLTACDSDAIMYTAENNARRYAKKLGMKVVGVSCSTKDSDMDGYTSCDLNTDQGVKMLECTYRSGGGCKNRMNKMQMGQSSTPFWR